MDRPPRVALAVLPTPTHHLPRMSEDLGLDLWIKRDDLTGLALGGNKARKLEYILADALAQGAEYVCTCGSIQSNFIRQLGAGCSMLGLKCAAAVMDMPFDAPAGKPPGSGLASCGGNQLIDDLLGVELRVFADGSWEKLYEHAESLALELEAAGKRVYRVPVGGSSPLAAYAFVRAAEEVDNFGSFDWIVVASSSGGTQTGLTHAAHGTKTQVLGILADPEPEIAQDFAELSMRLDVLVGSNLGLAPTDFLVDASYVGAGYGIPSEQGNEAIRALARREGILLDPIYSAKAFAGLCDLARRGKISGKVLFWHTGGTPALFAMESPI